MGKLYELHDRAFCGATLNIEKAQKKNKKGNKCHQPTSTVQADQKVLPENSRAKQQKLIDGRAFHSSPTFQ